MESNKGEIKVFSSYKNNKVEGRFNPTTGEVFYDNILFKNPTAASVAAVIKHGGGKHITQNGWKFWKFFDEDGQTKAISEIKHLLIENSNKQ